MIFLDDDDDDDDIENDNDDDDVGDDDDDYDDDNDAIKTDFKLGQNKAYSFFPLQYPAC